jgi:hypothetical protein
LERTKKMIDLSTLSTKRTVKPPRIVIYGSEGVGKTTLCSQAPNPIIIPTEDGLGVLQVAAFPLCKTYQDVTDAIGALYLQDHSFKTVALDSADWLEQLIWMQCAVTGKDGGAASIENHGYGKGYVMAADRLRETLEGLAALQDKGMQVIVTAHAKIKKFEDPSQESGYDRYVLKLHEKAAGLLCEWADIVAFATQDVYVRSEGAGFGKKQTRAVAVGGNVMRLYSSPSFVAKTRWPLPASIPLNWSAFEEEMKKVMAQ